MTDQFQIEFSCGTGSGNYNNFRDFNRLTIFEKARIIGTRAKQLSDDAKPFVDIGNCVDCILIATKELVERKLPIIVRRRFPDGTFRDWPLEDLLIPEVDF